MAIVNKEITSGKSLVDMTVAAENLMDVRVSSGGFTVADTAYTLSADAVHTCTADATYPTKVIGYLCWNSNTSAAEVLVDEIVEDGVDQMFNFADDDDRTLLHYLFSLVVPAAATDITGEDLNVTKLVARPDETPPARS